MASDSDLNLLHLSKFLFQVDTYSFGVILFDLVTGKRPQTKIGKNYLLDLMRDSETLPQDLVDASYTQDSHLSKILYEFAKKCTLDR